MALYAKHYINGVEIVPVNNDEIGFKMDWTSDAEEAELSVDNIILANKAKQLVIDHIENGVGLFEGIPYSVSIGGINLDYYIDLEDNPKISGFGDSEIEVSIKRRFGVNDFIPKARGLSFESINKTHPISLIDVPYIIVRDNQLEMLIMLGISTYTLTKALIEGVRELVVAVTDFIKITFVGTGVFVGQIIAAALLLAARIVYVAALLLALIDLTKQIIEIIFPKVRKFKASTFKTLLETGCQKLGFQFSSSIIDEYSALTYLPVPLKEKSKSIFTTLFSTNTDFYTKGYPTAKDSTPTLWTLFEEVKKMFNAKVRIVGNTVFLENKNYWKLDSGVQINNMLTLQDKRENEWSYNFGESWKRYVVSFKTDPSDIHTLDQIEGTDCEYSTEPISINNADLVSIKGLADININFAFGSRKTELTAVEKFALPFAKLADKVINFFDGNSNLVSKVQGRIGVLQISQLYFTVPKIMYCLSGRQPKNYLDFISANNLYINHHKINEVKSNFKRIYSTSIPFSVNNFESLLDNNFVTDQNGYELEILTMEWYDGSKEASIEYAKKDNGAFNTKTILING